MNNRNPNRDLSMDEVRQQIAEKLPGRAPDLEADRLWLWLPTGGKPSEEERAVLKELGFGFTPRPHILPDGTSAHWFHACGGAVLRRRRKQTETAEDNPEPEPALAAFMAWAKPKVS